MAETTPAMADLPGEESAGRICRLEAILFIAREPLSTRKLSQYANLADATEARTLIRQLNDRYDTLGRAFRVEEVAGGFQLMTRPKFAAWLRRLEEVPKETRLSAPALETLAVIAYRQPSGRAEIESIRGVNCGEILRQLMDRDLVRIAGRSDELGRPYLYATTKRFLQLFGLRSLDDLPRALQLKKSPATSITNSSNSETDTPACCEEESQVTATIRSELAPEELRKLRVGNLAVIAPLARDEDAEAENDAGDDDVDAEDDDFDDEDDDDDLEDDEFDDVDDEELDEEDDDFEDDEWEEVEDDEEEEEEWDDEDDEDWDDEDDEEEGDEEEEEEEVWE
jgi:segregation and condensation protein B